MNTPIVYLENPFVPAMASGIHPSMEHGMAGVVHDSFPWGIHEIYNRFMMENHKCISPFGISYLSHEILPMYINSL